MINICSKCFTQNSLFACSCGSVYCSACQNYIQKLENGEKIIEAIEYECFVCGRSQAYAPKGTLGGMCEEMAHKIGWKRVKNEWMWLCPICSGNEDKLNKTIFNNEE